MSLYQRIAEIIENEETAAVCTIVETQGSTPRRAGGKMLVFPGGRVEGTIGGGKLEALVAAEAEAALRDGQPRTLDYSMVDPARGERGRAVAHLEALGDPPVG